MSTDSNQNLIVLTEHILHLADKQAKAADQITGANRAIVDPAREVMDSHGLVCGLTNLALESATTARRASGGTLLRVSNELHEELISAAAHYEHTDGATAGDLRCEL
jgi:hypothetical protein